MRHRISVRRERRGLGSPEARRAIIMAAGAVLRREGIEIPCEIGVLLTDDEGIRAINRDHRGIDRATDVLSFPALELSPDTARETVSGYYAGQPGGEPLYLGDMALSLERARAQGEEFGHSGEREIIYLTVHSVLHLLGYDHMDEGAQKRVMREREKSVMDVITGAGRTGGDGP